MRHLTVPKLIGLLLLAGGVLAGAGWLLQIPELVRLMTGAAMVLNTALCFAIAGVALLSDGRPPAQRRWLQVALGTAILLGSATVLAEHLLARDLGIDGRALHAWYRDDNPHPGRMSPPTAFGFALAGASFVLMHHVRALWSGLLVQGLTASVIGLGIVGIISYLLRLPLVYENYPFRQMALATAAAFILTGTALWSCWRRHPWYGTRRLIDNEARRISLNSTIVLASIVCISLLAGLVVMQRQVEALAKASLLWPLESRINLFKVDIELRSTRATDFASRPELTGLLRGLAERPADHEALQRLRESSESILPLGFSGIAFRDLEGTEWLQAGRFSPRSELATDLRNPHRDDTLLWSEGSFLLQSRIPIRRGDKPLGIMVTVQRLAALSASMENAYDFASSGDIAICARQDAALACFPHRYVPEVHTMPYDVASPMALALANKTGVMTLRDSRSRNVMAAYAPIGTLGLGMVVKMDTSEIYAPLHEQLYATLILGSLLVAGGALLLYWRVTPITRSLYHSDQRLRLALESSRSAWWDWDLRRGTVRLSEHWQAMLGNAPGVTVTQAEDLEKLAHPDDLRLVKRKLRAALKSSLLAYDVEHRVRRADGRWLWISSVGRVVERDSADAALRMIGINTDISLRKEAALRIEHQAKHDVLTGLANRATFFDRLEHAMSRVRRNKNLMAVMYLDIDRFKQINDSFGHSEGDMLLKDFAKRLTYCVRTVDTVARMGGDEFVVILEELTHRDDGRRLAEKMVREMRPEFPLEHHTVEITVSAGVAFFDGGEPLTADQLVHDADSALYEAKNSGRNTYAVAA